eukprot:755315-Hanusia_phi.AAC.2
METGMLLATSWRSCSFPASLASSHCLRRDLASVSLVNERGKITSIESWSLSVRSSQHGCAL